MKRVIIISGSLPPIRCGVGAYTARLAEAMAASGMDFELLSTEGVDSVDGVPLSTVGNWKVVSIPKIISLIDKSRAGIVHIEFPAVGYRRQLGINILPYALRLLRPKLKLVITLHEYSQSRWIGRARNRVTIWPAHKVIVSNWPDMESLKKLGRKVKVIPIGANFETARRQPDLFRKIMTAQKLDPAAKTIVFFGYAFPAKRLELLLESLKQPGLEAYQLLIFPEIDEQSAYHNKLLAMIEALNKKRVRVGLAGYLDGPEASVVLQESRYFVLPSQQALSAKSGTAIAAVENGLVLISRGSKRPQDTEPFVHGANCFLLDDISPSSIAEAILHLDAAPSEVRAIQRGAKELSQYFSWDNIIRQHQKLYEEL